MDTRRLSRTARLEDDSEEISTPSNRRGTQARKRRESDSRLQVPEAKRRQTDSASDDRHRKPFSRPQQLGSPIRTPDKERKISEEGPSESFRNNWYRERREWLAERALQARSQSPGKRQLRLPAELTKLPTKNARPYDLKYFWRDEHTVRRMRWKDSVVEALKSGSRTDPDNPSREAWRMAQIHELRRPKKLGWDLVRRIVREINENRKQPRKLKRREETLPVSATVTAPDTPPATATVTEPESPDSIQTLPEHIREADRLAEIQARFPSWVIAADKYPEWFAEVKKRQEEREAERKARELRDRQRLEDWKARGPVPRRYVAIQWADKRPPPYLEPSEDDIIALETQMANGGFCAVARTEPLLLSARNGHKMVLATQEDAKLHYLKVGMGGLARQLSSYITNPGEKLATVGFHAEYLNASSATELIGLRQPNLARAVHPILQRDMWHDTSDDVYEILPAFRTGLAVFYGERITDPVASAKKGTPVTRIPGRVEFSHERAESLQRDVFYSLRGKAHFKFGIGKWRNDPEGQDDAGIYGRSGMVPLFGLEPKREDFAGAIWLNKDFLTVAKKYVQLRRGANTAERLRFNFLFAVVVTHEIAHTAGARASYIRREGAYGSEPIMYDEHVAEAGISWEVNTFGGTVNAIDGRVDGKFGLSVSGIDANHKVLAWPIPMGYIEELQQQETWDKLYSFDFNNPTNLRIPTALNPAHGMYTGVMREPLLDFMKLHHPEVFPATAMEEAILAPLLPQGQAVAGLPQRDRYKLLLDHMAARDNLTDGEVIAMWELWWQYESVGYWAAVQDEKKWTLLENHWRLSGGKSSSLMLKRYYNDLSSIPDRFNPLVIGSWGPAEIQEYLKKRENVLGIPVSIPWDKQEEDGTTTSNSDDTPPHERDEFKHHPRGFESPENPFRFLQIPRPGESREEFEARARGDPMSIDHPGELWGPPPSQPRRRMSSDAEMEMLRALSLMALS